MPPSPNRAGTRTAALTSWADAEPPAGSASLAWLHKIVRVVLITLREADINSLSLRSGALTYTILLSMVPMLAMSTAVVKGLGGGDQLREVVYRYIDTLDQASPKREPGPDGLPETAPVPLPGTNETAGLTVHLRSAADQLFDYVDRTNFATLGTFGVLGMFLTVILVLTHIETAMNTIWHVEDARSILRKISDYLTLLVLLPISINVALAAGTVLGSQSLALRIDHYIPAAWIQFLLLKGVPVFFLTVTLYVVYIFFPNTKPRSGPTLIGALLAGSLWFTTQNVYISLQIGVARYNAIYGSFATVPLFLVWIYFGWLFVLLGAQVAYALQHQQGYRLVSRRPVPSLLLSAALDLNGVVTARFLEQRGSSMEDIAQALPGYEADLLEQSCGALIGAGLLHHSSETGEILPSRPPTIISHREIIEAVLGTAPPDTEGGRISRRALTAAAQASSQRQEERVQSGAKAGNPGDDTSASVG